MVRRGIVVVMALFDLAVLLHLAGSVIAAAMFVAFVLLLVAPALALARRIAPMPAAALLVVMAFVPWFFARKAIGMPLVVDAITAAILIAAALMTRSLQRPRFAMRLTTFVLLPLLFALVWLGWNARGGGEVRNYGLFAIDFGNLVSVVSTLRASPGLPLGYVAGMGRISYHWLYFTIPASLADAFGGAMPNANALVLMNVLAAMLLVQTLASYVRDRRAVLLVLFAPFTFYFYQALAARIRLGPLALPVRNHLLLSPLNSMLTFGNNTIAIVFALVTLRQLETWNEERRVRDLAIAAITLALVVGYSVTLVFPLALTVLVWTVLRGRRRLFTLAIIGAIGLAFAAIFVALGVLAGGGSRHIQLASDDGQFLRMIVFGALPLWVAAVIARRRALTPFHLLIACCVAVPSLLFIAGSPTGATDFSMKTASLIAIAFAPLLAFDGVPRARLALVVAFATLGVVQTAAYVLQFPYYRVTHSAAHSVAIPRDYAAALMWIRDQTPRTAIVVDPHEIPNRDETFTVMLAERRVWLPTAYTDAFVGALAPSRGDRWRAFVAGDAAAGDAIAAEADVLLSPVAVRSPAWRPVRVCGAWTIYRSTRHTPS
jgi:hypothetical protein